MSEQYTNKLQGHKVLVIGGSTGFGFAVAQASLEHGASVIIASSKQANLDKAVQSLQAAFQTPKNEEVPRISATVCNLRDPATVEQNIKDLFEFCVKDGVYLDHVVYTAGDPYKLPTLDTVVPEDHLPVATVRITGALLMAKYAHRYMEKSEDSSITLTGSTTQRKPRPGWAVVNGFSGSTESLSRSLAIELKPIRVNCVMPGFFHTELLDNAFGKEQLEPVLAGMAKESVVGRVGTASEAAEAYLYLMKCTFATGSSVILDGGRDIVL